MRRSRVGRLSKMQQLLDYQFKLCNSCGLPPSKLMVEGRKKRRTRERRTKKKRRERLEDGGGEDIVLSLAPLNVRSDMRLKEGAKEPDAGLRCPEGGGRKRGRRSGGEKERWEDLVFCPPSLGLWLLAEVNSLECCGRLMWGTWWRVDFLVGAQR